MDKVVRDVSHLGRVQLWSDVNRHQVDLARTSPHLDADVAISVLIDKSRRLGQLWVGYQNASTACAVFPSFLLVVIGFRTPLFFVFTIRGRKERPFRLAFEVPRVVCIDLRLR